MIHGENPLAVQQQYPRLLHAPYPTSPLPFEPQETETLQTEVSHMIHLPHGHHLHDISESGGLEARKREVPGNQLVCVRESRISPDSYTSAADSATYSLVTNRPRCSRLPQAAYVACERRHMPRQQGAGSQKQRRYCCIIKLFFSTSFFFFV